MPITKSANGKVATEGFVLQTVRLAKDELKQDISRLDEKVIKVDIKLDQVLTQLDSIAGDFQKFDQEQTFLSHRQSIHSDKIEKLEISAFGSVQVEE